MRRGLLLVLGLLSQSCHAHAPSVTPAPAVVRETARPKRYQLPPLFQDRDLLCLDVDRMGTCATIADVRIFLRSRKG